MRAAVAALTLLLSTAAHALNCCSNTARGYVTASYRWEKWCLEFAHISHGRKLNIREDAPNHGINFLFLEYRCR